MRELALLGAIALAMALCACKRGAGASRSERADELYRLNCARCHGMDGAGPRFSAPPGGGPPPPQNFRDPGFQASRSDEEIRRIIVEGKGAMPPFGRIFDAEELELLVEKVRSFR